MSVLSKIGPAACVHLLRAGRKVGEIGSGGTEVRIVRHGHDRNFKKRTGTMTFNKVKDGIHFYILGIGVWPCILITAFFHLYFGPCEFTEYPKEGQPPHYWQFERSPLRQYIIWAVGGTSDIKYHECNLALFARGEVKNRWRWIERRVQHLISERMDYKAYYYTPLTNEWIEQGKKRAAQHNHFLPIHGAGVDNT